MLYGAPLAHHIQKCLAIHNLFLCQKFGHLLSPPAFRDGDDELLKFCFLQRLADFDHVHVPTQRIVTCLQGHIKTVII